MTSAPNLLVAFEDVAAAAQIERWAAGRWVVRRAQGPDAQRPDAQSEESSDVVLCDSAHALRGWLRERERATPCAVRVACVAATDAAAEDAFADEAHAELLVALPLTELGVRVALRSALAMRSLKAERDEAERLKRAFIEVASHELRSPLTVLLGLTHLAMRSPDAAPAMVEKLKRIYAAGERLARLDDELVSMLVADRETLWRSGSLQPLAPIIEASVDSLRPFVERRRQTVTVALAADLGALTLDAVRLRDALDHLLMNAVKFTPDGGEITVQAVRRPTGVSITVRDSGIGIGADAVPHVFDLFFTETDVSRHSSGRYEFCRRGVGLGLSVVRAFARSTGGEVTVETAEGRGSAFTLTLPDAAPADARCRPAESA